MAATYATDADLVAAPFSMGSVAVATRTWALGLARLRVGLDEYGDSTSYLHALLAAHYAADVTPGAPGAGAGVTSKSIGALSVAYAVAAASDDGLSRTRWGRLFAEASPSGPIGIVGRLDFPIVGPV